MLTTHRPLLNRLCPIQPGLIPLILMVSLPFLNTHHRNPITSFYAEWWAALAGLITAFCLLNIRFRRNFSLPKIFWLPIALASMVFLQWLIAPGTRQNAPLLAVLYFLWVVLLMGLSNTLSATYSKEEVTEALASGILIGALLSAIAAAAQWSGFTGSAISANPSGQIYGNLNQPNHLALQLWMGISAAIYLHAKDKASTWLVAGAIAFLVFFSLLSGSRSLWLYAIGLLAFSLCFRRDLNQSFKHFRWPLYALGVVIAGNLALWYFSSASGSSATQPVLPSLERGSEGVRGGLWWMAWQMGIAHPLGGMGWGNFASASFTHIEQFQANAPATLNLAPGEHAHNIFFNLFAELGFLAPVLLVGFGALWLWRVFQQRIDASSQFALTLLLLLTIHAQLEYTLWYTYFLGIAAIALALTDPAKIIVPLRSRLLVGLILSASLLTLYGLRQDYSRLEAAMNWQTTSTSATPEARWQQAVKELIDLRRRSQFGPYVDLAMIGAMPVDRDALPDKLAVCATGIAFSPSDYAVYKCAVLLALDGRASEAEGLMSKALLAYPQKAAEAYRSLESLSESYPELLPLAKQAKARSK